MSLVKRYSKQLIGFAGFSSLLVLWQLAGFLNILPKFVLPTPLEIGNAFVRDRVLLIHHSLVWLWYASKTGFDHYYGCISHRSQSVRWFSALRSRYSEIVSDYASQSLSDFSPL